MERTREHCWLGEQLGSPRRKLTRGLRGTVKKLNLVRAIFSALTSAECWSQGHWRPPGPAPLLFRYRNWSLLENVICPGSQSERVALVMELRVGKDKWRVRLYLFLFFEGGILEHVCRLRGKRQKRSKMRGWEGIHRARFLREREGVVWQKTKDVGKCMKRGRLAQVAHTCGARVFSRKKRGGHLLCRPLQSGTVVSTGAHQGLSGARIPLPCICGWFSGAVLSTNCKASLSGFRSWLPSN